MKAKSFSNKIGLPPRRAKNRTAKGPEPERLKIFGDWKEAVRIAMRKPKPPEGWPK